MSIATFRGWLLCALFACGLWVPCARAADVPRADGWVTDLAGLLSSAEEASLESELEAWKQGSGHELAVLTVPDLGGRPIEEFSLDVARTWGLGRKGENDGALLVVAKADRKMRIEVGRGLEGNVTDLVCGRIIRDILTPAFRRGDFGPGIVQGVRAIRAAAGGDLSYLPRESAPDENWVPALIITIVVILFLIRFVRRLGGWSGGLPHRTWHNSGSWGTFSGSIGGGRSSGGGGFSGFGGGGGFSGGGASGGW